MKTLGGVNSAVEFPNHSFDQVFGISQTVSTDPLSEQWSCSYPAGSGFLPYTGNECHGFRWRNGRMTDLGTLGGNNSFAAGANVFGQSVGWAETSVHDSTCIAPQVLQFEGVTWDLFGSARVLRPLPQDPDSAATAINDRGNAVGISGSCGTSVGATSAKHMALWRHGIPMQIPSLGGSAWNTPTMINDFDSVVGFSDLPGDDNGANFNGHAFLWTAERGITNLGTLPSDTISYAYGINNRGQIVGQSCTTGCASSRAFLYENRKMYDLNALLAADSSSYNLIFANDINDEGQITGLAVNGSGAIVAFRLIPTGRGWSGTAPTHSSADANAVKLQFHVGPFGRLVP